DLPAAPAKPRAESCCYRVGSSGHDDRNGACCFSCCLYGEIGYGQNDVDLESHQFRSEGRIELIAAVRVSVLQHDVFALNPAELSQTLLPGGHVERRGYDRYHTDAVDSSAWLRRGAAWCKEERSTRHKKCTSSNGNHLCDPPQCERDIREA